ncbi:MAG TPA: ligand-binding protein SH3, partial [Pseudoxanthomonas sp.]|nr:ligand-binding protein SH3 [Pseudoxanthomonas sp.]
QLEEATSAARAARGGGSARVSQRQVLPTTTVTASAPAAAQTAPLGAEPAATQHQGFQPVAEGEVRTEQLNTTP